MAAGWPLIWWIGKAEPPNQAAKPGRKPGHADERESAKPLLKSTVVIQSGGFFHRLIQGKGENFHLSIFYDGVS